MGWKPLVRRRSEWSLWEQILYNQSVDYHVEELADSSGVAVDTIRYYQREKLLAPPRREGRRAFYDDAHLERIQEIRSLAQQGFSLAQIRELSAGDGSGLLVDLAQQNAVDPDLDKAELARRAEIPEFLIDVVVSAGLLTPSGEGDDQRFAADAVDMLVAARTLVNEGVSLEELTALAMRHATHIENVVDDAIELFKRNSRRHDADGAEGGGHDDLVSLMHRLVPVASNLVGQHFERTLRTRALARLGDDTPIGGGVSSSPANSTNELIRSRSTPPRPITTDRCGSVPTSSSPSLRSAPPSSSNRMATPASPLRRPHEPH